MTKAKALSLWEFKSSQHHKASRMDQFTSHLPSQARVRRDALNIKRTSDLLGSAARSCSRCNHIFVPKSTAKKMHAAAKQTPEVIVALQSSPTPLFRLSTQQRASVLEQLVDELSVAGAFGHRLLGGRVDYLLQWSGGDYDGHTSWVKATSATNCNALIASYWATGPNDLAQTSIAAQDQSCGDEDLRASCSAMGLVLFRLSV